ncbi:hypothetical protein ACLK19_11100 [Escherichia coli]
MQSSQELHRLQSGVDDHARLARTSALARHTDNAEAMWSGVAHILYVDDDWRMEHRIAMGCRCQCINAGSN